MSDAKRDEFTAEELDALKEAEKRKLYAADDVPEPAELKADGQETIASSPSAGGHRQLGLLLVALGALLLFATVNGVDVWRWWWLIFLVKPVLWGGWCGRRSC